MSNDLNRCSFIGRLGRDPELRHMQNGKAVTNFSIACGSSWRDKESGEKQERTEWINIVAFDKLAEICAAYLFKGSQVYIEGSIRTRKWQAKDGTDRYSTEIVSSHMQMLGSKSAVDRNKPSKPEKEEFPEGDGEFSDDIPF